MDFYMVMEGYFEGYFDGDYWVSDIEPWYQRENLSFCCYCNTLDDAIAFVERKATKANARSKIDKLEFSKAWDDMAIYRYRIMKPSGKPTKNGYEYIFEFEKCQIEEL